jgi:hypothetical protein
MSVKISRQTGNISHQPCSSHVKPVHCPISQFYCNLCFVPLMATYNIHRASFVTSCGHFYCEQCAQTSRNEHCLWPCRWMNTIHVVYSFSCFFPVVIVVQAFQGVMPTCKICQYSSTNLTCMDLRKVIVCVHMVDMDFIFYGIPTNWCIYWQHLETNRWCRCYDFIKLSCSKMVRRAGTFTNCRTNYDCTRPSECVQTNENRYDSFIIRLSSVMHSSASRLTCVRRQLFAK